MALAAKSAQLQPVPFEAVSGGYDLRDKLIYGVGPYLLVAVIWETVRVVFNVSPGIMPSRNFSIISSSMRCICHYWNGLMLFQIVCGLLLRSLLRGSVLSPAS